MQHCLGWQADSAQFFAFVSMCAVADVWAFVSPQPYHFWLDTFEQTDSKALCNRYA